jgi:hypothetical protein
MKFGGDFSDFIPLTVLALFLAFMAACFAFVAVFILTATFALGMDFGILVGLAAGAAAAIGTFLLVFGKGYAYMSN